MTFTLRRATKQRMARFSILLLALVLSGYCGVMMTRDATEMQNDAEVEPNRMKNEAETGVREHHKRKRRSVVLDEDEDLKRFSRDIFGMINKVLGLIR